MLNRAKINVILLLQLLVPVIARADGGWDGLGNAFVFGVFPFLCLVTGLIIYLFVSNVSKIQKIWLVLIFMFSTLIIAIAGVVHVMRLPLFFETILSWVFPLCVCLIYSKWQDRMKKNE